MSGYIRVFDDAKFKLLFKKSETEIINIIKKYDKKRQRVTISFNGIKRFLEVQELLNKFAIARDVHIQRGIYSIYQLTPTFEHYHKDEYLSFHLIHESHFEWDRGDRRTVSDCENFLIENFTMNPNFATHKDQDGFLWKPSTFSPDWYCFVKGSWVKLEIKEHVKLVALL